MKIRTKRSNIAFILATVSAVMAGVVVWQLAEKISNTETIVVSTRYIPPFTRIQPSDVKTVLVPTDTGIRGLQADPNAVVGHYSMIPIPAGYPVTTEAMSASSSFSDFLTQYEEETGQTGTEVFLNASTQAEKLVQAGEQVELLVPGSTANGTTTYTPYVVRVLNVLGNPPISLGLFIPDSISATVTPAILNGSVQVVLISQQGTYATAPREIPSSNDTQGTKNTTTPTSTSTVAPATSIQANTKASVPVTNGSTPNENGQPPEPVIQTQPNVGAVVTKASKGGARK